MYLLQGFLVGFLPVFILTAVGALLSKEETTKTITIGVIVGIIYWIFIWLIRWGFSADIYGPTPLFGALIIGSIIAAFVAGISEETGISPIPGIIIAVLGIVWVIIIGISNADINESTAKGKLLDVTTQKVNSKILELADPAHICLVDENVARVKAEKALTQIKTSDEANAGSRFKIGNGTKQFVDGQLWWIFPLEFTTYFQWKRYPEVPGYIRVSAEDPFKEAQAVQYNKQGNPIKIKYLNSACFDNLGKRYLRKHGYLTTKLDDWTFEVDDNWNPYYTVTNVEWTLGYGGDINKGVVVFDLQTGEAVNVPIEKASKEYPWIDRVISIDVLNYQAEKWGMYNKTGWKFTSVENGKRQKQTPGWYLTYDDGKCYWFTGWTSYSGSSDLIGVSLTDGQTGKTIYYPTEGSTEDVAYAIAKSHWSNFDGYTPTELVPYNIYGTLTYVMPIVYNSNQFVGVSLVSVLNKDLNAKGKTLEEALSAYRSAMSIVTSDRGVPYEGQPQNLIITGKVAEVGMPFLQGQNQMYPFTLQGIKKIFQVNYSLQNAEISFVKPGREVIITYMDTKEKIITCQTFDIPGIVLSNENPAQARWLEDQKDVKKEEGRINNIQENKKILEEQDLGTIHPDSLQKFIDSQSQKSQ